MKKILTSLTFALIVFGCNTPSTSVEAIDAGDASVDVVDGGMEPEVLMSVMPAQSACVCVASASTRIGVAPAISASVIPSASAAPISSK